jgi:hypothetical protein
MQRIDFRRVPPRRYPRRAYRNREEYGLKCYRYGTDISK